MMIVMVDKIGRVVFDTIKSQNDFYRNQNKD